MSAEALRRIAQHNASHPCGPRKIPFHLPNACTLAVLTRLYYMSIDSANLETDHERSQSHVEAREWLVKQGLARVEHLNGRTDRKVWNITDKGKALVDHFLATPLPISKTIWSVPT